MIVKQTIMLAMGLLLLVGMASAADLSPSTITNPNAGSWLIAGEGGTSAITVHVRQVSPSLDVSGANVAFSVSDSSLGTISPVSVTTGSDGIASTVFMVKSSSGNVTINANITYNDGTTNFLDLATFQRIDHDVPQFAFFDYPPTVTAGSVTRLNITLTDRWNNRIDDKNTAETVHLSGLGEGGSGFSGTYVPQISVPTDAEGNVSVMVRVSTVAGSNNIWMNGIGNIVGKLIDIEGVSDCTPVSISQITPSPDKWSADGTHAFNLYYSVKDKYDNPLDGANISIISNIGESYLTSTSNGGIAYLMYGPKDVTGTYTITVRTVENSSILCTSTGTTGFCSQDVIYYSQDPVDMILTASPQTLVSLDVDPNARALVQARVVDVAGNPVSNETVTFEQGADSLPDASGGSYTETAGSHLVPSAPPVTALTDTNGFATVAFIPGKFPTFGQPGYSATATGTSTVTARWTGRTGQVKTRTVTFTWKNYPYLTVTTMLDKTSAKIGDLLRITIIVTGNGAALQPKPIDVLLLLDNSGSMGSTSVDTDRISQSKTAAMNFIKQMRQGTDRVGVILYDKNTDPAFSVYVPLTSDLKSANDSINSYKRTDTKGYHTRMRYALYDAITLMKGWTADRDSVKAIIHMTDGAWSMEGDPLARGTGFDMSFGPAETNSTGDTSWTGLHSVWAGNVPVATDLTTAPYRYFDDLGGGDSHTGSLSNVPNGQKFDSGTTGWLQDTNEATQKTTTKSVTYYTNAQYTRQNMSVYANQSKIRVYSIGFGSSIASGSEIEKVLKIISGSTAAFYQHVDTQEELNDLYTKIAGDLNVQAGGSTKLDLNMGTITVDGMPGKNSFDYLNYTAIPVGGRTPGNGKSTDSTYVDMYHTNTDGSINDYYNYTRDDTKNWSTAQGYTLRFDDIGTMRLYDTWQTSFVFNLTNNGTLVLFGPGSGSILTFTDTATGNTQIVQLDSKTVSVYKSTVNQGFGAKTLLVDQLKFIDTPDPDIWTIQWNTTYTGESVATETVQYRSSEPGSQWVLHHQYITDKPPSVVPITDSLQIDTSSWSPGTTYTIMVTATAANNDASPSSASIGKQITSSSSDKTYIKLE